MTDIFDPVERQICSGIIGRFVGDRQCRVLITNEDVAMDGMIVRTAGLDLTQYRRNPIVLSSHDTAAPIGTMSGLQAAGTSLYGTVQFAPAGVDPESDRVCALVKSDILRGCSIGFTAIETKPINGVVHVTRSVLHEVSIVSLPACHACMVTERAADLATPEAEERRAKAIGMRVRFIAEANRRAMAVIRRAEFLQGAA